MGLFGEISDGWKALKLWRWLKGGGLDRMEWERLKSRKLWYVIAASLLVTFMAVKGAPPEAIGAVMILAVNYLGIQTVVDASGGARDWKSRKLWASAGGSVLLTILAYAKMPAEIVQTIQWVLVTYVDGQGAVDFFKARKNGGK